MIVRCSRIRVALWQGTGVKLSSKATAYEHFYVSHSALAEPYAYLLIEAYDGNVGNNIKLKHPKIMTNDSKVCSMNRTNWVGVFSLEEACFCYVYDYLWEMEHKESICFWQCKRALESIQNDSMKTVPERFCSVNGLYTDWLALLFCYVPKETC